MTKQIIRLETLLFAGWFMAGACLAGSSGQQVVRINAGSAPSTYTSPVDGAQWLTDRYFKGGTTAYSGGYAIANTNDSSLYSTARCGQYGDFYYDIPVVNGNYVLTLKFAELTYSQRGQRVFNVAVNNATVLNNFDILAETAPRTALDKSFPVSVGNGRLRVRFIGVTGRGIINAIQVVPAAPQAQPVSVSVSPSQASVTAGQTVQFSASVANTSNTGVTWTASAGTISASGLYSAPPVSQTTTVQVTATSAADLTKSASATVTVNPVIKPVLQLSTAAMAFGGTAGGTNPAAQSVAIANSGNGTLSWTASGNQPWLAVAPASGTAPATVAVSVSTAGLNAGTYSGLVTVNGGSAGTRSVAVTLNIAAAVTIAISPAQASLAAGQTAQFTASVGNTSNTSVAWMASAGTISATGLYTAPASVSAGVTATVTAASAADPTRTASATITFLKPVLQASPAGLTFNGTAGGDSPTAQNVAITNTGNGTLAWTATANQPWITVSAASGGAPGTLGISVSTAGMSAGTYSGAVTVNAGTAGTQSVAIALNLAPAVTISVTPSQASLMEGQTLQFSATVGNSANAGVNWSATAGNITSAGLYTAPATVAAGDTAVITATSAADTTKTATAKITFQKPVLQASPASLTFTTAAGSATPAAQNVSITNTGTGTLNWTATAGQPWLTLSAASGTAPSTLAVGVSTSSLAAGTYTGSVTIKASPGGTQTVTVTLTTAPAVTISVNPASVSLTAGQQVQFTAAVGNTSNSAVTWTASAGSIDATGLYTAPSSVTPGGTAQVTATSVADGSKQASSGVTFVKPVLQAGPASLTFSATAGGNVPAAQNVSVTNTGNGTLTWSATSNQPWLTLSAASGTAPSTLAVAVSTSGMTAGTYSGTVTVNGGNAGSQAIGVTLTLAAGVPPGNSPGKVYTMKNCNSAFDQYTGTTSSTMQQFLQQHFTRMVVFSPYFDGKTSWYPNGLIYIDSYAIYPGGTFGTDVVNLHPDWIMHDASGNKLYIPWGCSNGTCPQYAADFSNPAFRQFWIDNAKAMVASGNYKGIFVDDVNLDWRVGDNWGNFVNPWDRNTNALMTQENWRRYFAEFLEAVRQQMPGIEICHNSIWYAGLDNGWYSNQYIQRQIAAANDLFIEFGINDGGLTGGTGTWSVDAVLRYVEGLNALGKSVVISGIAGGNATDLVGMEYGIAGYLLVNNGADYAGDTWMAFDPANWWPGLNVDLGAPAGARTWWNGVMRRDFNGGLVLLNPPGSPTVTLALPGVYKRVDGTSVTTVTLAAKQGAILLK